MKRYLAVFLGILTAIGGFVDIGDLVTNAQVGARFGMSMAWVVPVGVLGICVFAEMAGRVAAVSNRAVFDLVRERLGPRMGFFNLVGSVAVTFLTFVAEIGGVALALQLVTSVHYLAWVPLVALLLWFVLWRAKFSSMENVLGMLGLALIAFSVALWQLGPDWGELATQALSFDKPGPESWTTYAYFTVALFGAAMTPYEVFFFSSGGVEDRWTAKDVGLMRVNVMIGFPLGGLLSLSIAACAAVVFLPAGISVENLGQVGMPVGIALGKIGLAVVVLGFVAATFGAACETGLSVGYAVAQYFGFQWGKYVRTGEAAAFHAILVVVTMLAAGILLTAIDPVTVTEASVVFSAIALPLTYFPILVVANDPDYLGEHVNGRFSNALGTAYLVLVVVASVAAIPLMVITRMGTA